MPGQHDTAVFQPFASARVLIEYGFDVGWLDVAGTVPPSCPPSINSKPCRSEPHVEQFFPGLSAERGGAAPVPPLLWFPPLAFPDPALQLGLPDLDLGSDFGDLGFEASRLVVSRTKCSLPEGCRSVNAYGPVSALSLVLLHR